MWVASAQKEKKFSNNNYLLRLAENFINVIAMWIAVDKPKILILQAFRNIIFPQIHSPNSNKGYINNKY
jgi:hypothetical protein